MRNGKNPCTFPFIGLHLSHIIHEMEISCKKHVCPGFIWHPVQIIGLTTPQMLYLWLTSFPVDGETNICFCS